MPVEDEQEPGPLNLVAGLEAPRPEDDERKIEILTEMIEEKDRGHLDEEEMELFNYLCTN